MRIKILRTFTDLQASDPAEAEVPAGKEITVTADRGAELVELGLAEEVDAKPASKKPRKPAAPSTAAVPADAIPPAVPPAPDTGTASAPTT